MASASPLARTAPLTSVTGRQAVPMYATMTDRLRNARALQIVEGITDVDMLLRIVRAAADGLTMFYPGVAILDACDEIEREMTQEDAEAGL